MPTIAGAAARDMIEGSLCDLEPDAEPLQARRHRAAKVMEAPVFDSAGLVQVRLRLRKAIEWTSKTGKDQDASLYARGGTGLSASARTRGQCARHHFLRGRAGIVHIERS